MRQSVVELEEEEDSKVCRLITCSRKEGRVRCDLAIRLLDLRIQTLVRIDFTLTFTR